MAIEDECSSDMEQMILSRMRVAFDNQRTCTLFNNASDGTHCRGRCEQLAEPRYLVLDVLRQPFMNNKSSYHSCD